MSDDREQTPTRAALDEANRLVAKAQGHERRVALRERSALFLDKRGESEGAEHERREADLERDAARLARDQALALRGPTQTTEKGLEIPIPTRNDFIENLEKVVQRSRSVESDGLADELG